MLLNSNQFSEHRYKPNPPSTPSAVIRQMSAYKPRKTRATAKFFGNCSATNSLKPPPTYRHKHQAVRQPEKDTNQ